MRRSNMKTAQNLFRPTINGKYDPPKTMALTAREDDGAGGGDDEGKGKDEKLSAGQVTAINTIVHKAIGNRLSSQSFKDSIGTIAGEAAAAAISTATEGLSSKLDELVESRQSTDDKDKDKSGGWKDSPEYKAMMQREKDRDAEVAAMKAEREEERSKMMRSEERKALESSLRAAGVDEVKLRSCVATLIHEDKVLQRDSNGDVVYRIPRDGYDDDMGVAEGVKEFLGTDEGKAFLPAVGATGTGARGDSDEKNTGHQRKGTKQTKEEAASVVSAWLGGSV